MEDKEKRLLESLICYHSNNKTRMGATKDGGYVVVNGYSYDLLIGCGAADDISFEVEFLNLSPNIKGYVFDGTVENAPMSHKNLSFVKKNISNSNSENTTDLKYLINSHNSIFLKMDIDNSEWSWFDCLSNEHLKNISQICIEWHFPLNPHKVKVLERLSSLFYLFHIHGNNYKPCENVLGVEVPKVFECTYVRKDLLGSEPSLNKITFPTDLDFPNNLNKPDILLSTYPYVHDQ